jgi:hypothetical protein
LKDDCIFDDDSLLDKDNEVLENFDNLTDENYEEYPEETNYENKWDIEISRKEDNNESESEEEEGNANYNYQNSDDEEMRYRLDELRKIYKVKFFLLFYSVLSNKNANY